MGLELTFDSEKLLKKYNQPAFAVAYGSGVFKNQAPEGSTQIDFLFGVEDPIEWHGRNLAENPRDYSHLAQFLGQGLSGDRVLAGIQRMGAGVYYHSFVPFEEKEIKYGVISIPDLLDDLRNWTHLYAAGRLQKPVQVLKEHSEVNEAMQKNLENALLVSLLILPERFNERDLFRTIVSLSYMGDSRMQMGVDHGKVDRIVEGNLEGLREIYDPKMRLLGIERTGDMIIENNMLRYVLSYRKLPSRFIQGAGEFNPNPKDFEAEFRKALKDIVRSSSTTQTLKGIFSTGLSRSIRYAVEKLEKARKRG